MRLDNYLVAHKLCQSRNKAQSIIKEGLVCVNGKLSKKPSLKVEEDDRVTVAQHTSYVSRAAYKLLYFLEEISLDLQGRKALDIGSSTGGFTQVLLEKGVKEVSCVDVGHQQLHPTLRVEKRVHLFEGCDIRSFEPNTQFEIVVSDVALSLCCISLMP